MLRVDEGEAAGRGVAIEHRQGVRVRGGGVDVRPVRAHGDRIDAVEAVDAVHGLAVDLDEGERPARRVAAEHRNRIIELAGRVEVPAVRAERERRGASETVDAVRVVIHDLDGGEHAARRVAREDDDGVPRRDVEVRAVGADGDGLRAVEARLCSQERQRSRGGVAHERGERVVRAAGGVDVHPVGADGHRVDAGEAVDAVDAVALALDEEESAVGGVAGEDDQRVVLGPGGVNVRAIGADGDGRGAAEAFDPEAALPLLLDEGERAGRGVAREDGERAVTAAGRVEVGAIGAERKGVGGTEAVHAGAAVVTGADVREAVRGVGRMRGGEKEKGE